MADGRCLVADGQQPVVPIDATHRPPWSRISNSPFLTHLAQKQTARSSRAVANDPFSACPERSEGTIDQRLPVTHVSSKHPSLCEAVRPSAGPSSCSRLSA